MSKRKDFLMPLLPIEVGKLDIDVWMENFIQIR